MTNDVTQPSNFHVKLAEHFPLSKNGSTIRYELITSCFAQT